MLRADDGRVCPVSTQQHVTWGSIELLHNVVRTLAHLGVTPVVEYRAKVKLHGSNCAVQTPSSRGERVVAQSRTQVLSPDADYKGFATWVQSQAAYFASLAPGLVVFGEWCGPGVEKGMAISKASTKLFVVFAVKTVADGRMIAEPDAIRALLPPTEGLHVLPWEGEPFTIDFGSRESLDAAARELNERVAAVEREDPWVKRELGISGLGEGLVLYPVRVDGGAAPADPQHLMFKAKGDKHRTAGTKQAVQVDPAVAASIDEFVALMVTEARLEQGVSAVGGRTPASTGAFVSWLSADVRKESVAELEASGLSWAQVERAVVTRARSWYLRVA